MTEQVTDAQERERVAKLFDRFLARGVKEMSFKGDGFSVTAYPCAEDKHPDGSNAEVFVQIGGSARFWSLKEWEEFSCRVSGCLYSVLYKRMTE